MDYTFFKLSYILYLQKKYYPTFKLGDENVYVLPPILKRVGLCYSLAFPVAKRFDKMTISRPVGVILVNKKGKEKVYDLANFEFTNASQDFGKKYTYKTYEQEFLKVTLNLLLSCFPKFSLKKTKTYKTKYLPRVLGSFDKEYSQFYYDLEHNKISKITLSEKQNRTFQEETKKPVAPTKSKLVKKINSKVNLYIRKFVRDEVWGNFRDKNSIYKLVFLDFLGETLRKNFEFENEKQLLKIKKFEVAKDYAKAVNFYKGNSLDVDFLAKLLLIFMNAMLVEEKENKVIDSFENQIKDCCSIFDEEISKIDEKLAKTILKKFYSQLKKDYSTVSRVEFSNILLAYFFLFIN
jgi:hypothetical protein